MSLIDSNNLLPRLWDYISDVDYEKVEKVISEIPLEEQVIRCKDCKHWYSDADTGTACEFTNMSQPDDGFCNWAERRTDETD